MAAIGFLGQVGAEAAPWQTVRAVIREGGPEPLVPFLAVVCIIVGAVAVGLGVVWLVQRRRPAGGGGRALRLFRELGRELGLSRADQGWLTRVARAQTLPSPLTLLLSPATLEAHLQAYAAGLPTGRGQRVLARGRRVRARVFGENAEGPVPVLRD